MVKRRSVEREGNTFEGYGGMLFENSFEGLNVFSLFFIVNFLIKMMLNLFQKLTRFKSSSSCFIERQQKTKLGKVGLNNPLHVGILKFARQDVTR